MMIETENKLRSFITGIIPYIIILIVVILLKVYVVTPIRVNGASMYPTLEDQDIMILDIISYKLSGLKRFDVAVINQGKELIIKRVIGLPGEKVEYKDGVLYINEKEIEDPYLTKDMTMEDVSITVPEGEYYVLGDNRQNSLDSRTFGTFSKKQILGKTDFIVFPFKRFGSIKQK